MSDQWTVSEFGTHQLRCCGVLARVRQRRQGEWDVEARLRSSDPYQPAGYLQCIARTLPEAKQQAENLLRLLSLAGELPHVIELLEEAREALMDADAGHFGGPVYVPLVAAIELLREAGAVKEQR